MKIYSYCTKSGRPFMFTSGSDLYAVRHDSLRSERQWTLIKNNYRDGDYDWDDLESRLKDIHGITEYL